MATKPVRKRAACWRHQLGHQWNAIFDRRFAVCRACGVCAKWNAAHAAYEIDDDAIERQQSGKRRRRGHAADPD